MEAASIFMATAKPSRSRKQPSPKPAAPAQKQRQRDQAAQELTEKMAHAAYQCQHRHKQVSIARQQTREAAMKDAGIKPQHQPHGSVAPLPDRK